MRGGGYLVKVDPLEDPMKPISLRLASLLEPFLLPVEMQTGQGKK
jgi:hypothetical protein